LLLETGNFCWRVGSAPRATVLVDGQAYFDAAREALGQARRSIYFLNWAFEPDTRLRPKPGGAVAGEEDIAGLLKRLADERRDLDVRILCWQSALPVAATQKFFPIADRGVFAGSRVKFVLDGKLPLGACHHQKVIVIDDALAFCGGCDIGQDRWDTPAHLDDDPRRETTKGGKGFFPSRHEVMALVDGPPAEALGELFRRRWLRCTGETVEPSQPSPQTSWPTGVPIVFERARVGLSRTEASWKGEAGVKEAEALHLAAIAAAKHCIYMENQYFTSELMGNALARRLGEPKGPEVVLISGGRSPSYFDRITMDPTRSRFIERLQQADLYDRFRIYGPVTTLGRDMIVHAKLTLIDDQLVRIGSANLDNRSFGFDTECDLSLEADGPTAPAARATIAQLRTALVAHWLGCSTEIVEAAIKRELTMGGAIEFLRHGGYCRLRPIASTKLNPMTALIARLHIGDPMGPGDSFRPWKRRRALEARIRAYEDENPPPEAGDPMRGGTMDRLAS
jgi:phosphatidylserine/phosphatidylglycerophosphate/cardiolipin synthase-like enzyme